MIMYISYATDNGIFNKLLNEGKINSGNAVQKFNNSIMRGLGQHESLISLAAVGYGNYAAEKIEIKKNGIKYIVIKNRLGKLHKVWNMLYLWQEGRRIIREERPRIIFCDAIANSPNYISKLLARLFHIPVIGIVTDLPGTIGGATNAFEKSRYMKGFDAYILLTEDMNLIVNPQNKPHIVMEGLCSPDIMPVRQCTGGKKIIMYTGGIRKEVNGIEYFIEGFLRANIADCELHFYGIGNLVDWIKQISKNYPQIKYMGNVSTDEIVSRQRKADLLINPRPSKQEFCKYSFPSKTIEYMASGVPVLMTRLPGVPKEYFDYVYVIDEESSAGVCKVLKKIYSMSEPSRYEFGMKARKFVLEKKSCAVQTKRIYDFSKVI